MRTSRWVRVLAVLFALTMVASACDDSDDDGTAETDTGTDTEEDAGGDEAAETVNVTAVDFAFEGLPGSVDAGTEVSLSNESEAELHEFVAVQLPDDEDRSVEELLQLPQDELMGLLGTGVTDVILALPGQTDAPGAVEGDAVLDEPGRYAVICAIPTGVDPQVYLDAAAEAEGGPPQIEGGGPPHFTQGMFAEVTVE